MAMAAAASPARVVEKVAGQLAVIADSNPKAAQEAEDELRWKPVLELPCELTVDLPLPGFKIADLLQLHPGAVINAHWRLGQDVPLRLNGTLMGWTEFEVAGDRLAVRMTEMA
ncbi:MAG: FliM/FliN family flagellar motor C-terminal domain-containing protein [Candidatus Sulfotelmatobacter sp.]|jgi:flagellar motor switch/type III secretory pathway protein FliN